MPEALQPQGRGADIWPSDVKIALEAMQALATMKDDRLAEITMLSALKYIEQLESRLSDAGRICFVADRAGFNGKKLRLELRKAAHLCIAVASVMGRPVSH